MKKFCSDKLQSKNSSTKCDSDPHMTLYIFYCYKTGSVPGSLIVSSYWGDSAPFTLTSSYHSFLSPFTLKQHLVSSYSMTTPCCPVHDYEAQTHYHEGDTQSSKTDGLRMREKHQWNRSLIIKSSELQNRLWKSLYYAGWLLSQD